MRFSSCFADDRHAGSSDGRGDDPAAGAPLRRSAGFYQQIPRGATVVAEATGHLGWFRRLLSELGHDLMLGDAARLRALAVRKQKTDTRDAEHLLEVYLRGDFPAIWLPSLEQLDVRQLLVHRHRLVQMRTRVKNQLQGIALSQGICLRRRLWTSAGRAQLCGLALAPWTRRRRDELLPLLDQLSERIAPLDRAVEAEAERRPEAQRLMTHPGVGPVTALAFVLSVGAPQRFHTRGEIASYFGLIPSEHSSGNRQRFGAITKQGNRFVRWVLVEAGQSAARPTGDAELARMYRRMMVRSGHAKAKVAVAHRLAIRLWVMWRKQMTYADYCRTARTQAGPTSPVA